MPDMQRVLRKCQNPPLRVFTGSWAVAKASPAYMEVPFDLCFTTTATTVPSRPTPRREEGKLQAGRRTPALRVPGTENCRASVQRDKSGYRLTCAVPPSLREAELA